MNDDDEYANDVSGVVEVPYTALSEDALRGVIEEYISREGTDYGEFEIDMEAQFTRAMAALKSRRVAILFYPKTEHCQIVDRELCDQLCEQQ